MKHNRYLLNTLLTAVVAAYLLGCVLIRAFFPAVILPKWSIPHLVLLCLIPLVLDHYLAPEAPRCYLCISGLGALTFGLLPYLAALAGAGEALKLGLLGALVMSVTTWLFTTIQERLSTGPAAKTAALFSAVSLYLAAQCLIGIF